MGENKETSAGRAQAHSPSSLTEDGSGDIDHVAERKLVQKLDLYIIPFIMLLYLFSFLDRVNVGNARLYGMEEDLGLKENQFQIAVSLLFVSFIVVETPSNLVLKRFTPSRWIAFITTSWGIIATLTGLTQNFAGLIVCRLMLGAVEGGLFPGMAIYLTLFYTKHEIAVRVGFLFVSAAIGGATGGLLGYGIGFMDGVAGQRGWRWILIIEGLPTVALGIVTWFFLANDPEHASYLTDQEKRLVVARQKRQFGYTPSAQEFHKEDAYKALKDWKVWAFAFALFASDTMLWGYSIFLPTIIKGLGDWTTSEVQALTIPCYALGAVSYIIAARLSDSQQRRGFYSVIGGLVSSLGYALLLSNVGKGVHYFGCFLVAMGLYVVVGIPLAWLPSNQPRYGKRTVAVGLQLSIGGFSGIMAPNLYKDSESPTYTTGHSVTLAMALLATLIYGFMSWYLGHLNKARREGKEDAKVENMTDEEIEELGDESPRFMYTV